MVLQFALVSGWQRTVGAFSQNVLSEQLPSILYFHFIWIIQTNVKGCLLLELFIHSVRQREEKAHLLKQETTVVIATMVNAVASSDYYSRKQ